jgi:hypothetical protein
MNGGKTLRKSNSTSSGTRRKLNDYFKKLLEAKKKGAASFMYKGKKYERKMHSIRKGAPAMPIYKAAK